MGKDFERILDVIARKRLLIILVAGVLSFSGSWLVAAYRGVPVPYIHDEFSYILAGDTFAHGRLTNPTHPMWEHFETFHELMRPTYMSQYLPGQGFFLGLGQVLFGHPIYGVWLSEALMCMAICWMLYGWVPPRWALVGGMVGVMQFGVFTYWSQSYWGGAVAALGGALVFGALPRIFKYQRIRDVLWFGLGIAVLVNSRPLEGILIGIPLGMIVLPWKIKWERVKSLRFIQRIVLTFSLILLLIFSVTGMYNKAVTGHAGTFPYILYEDTYTAVPLLMIEPLIKAPRFNNEAMATFERIWQKEYYLEKERWGGFVKDLKVDTRRIFKFYFWYPLAVPSLIIIFLAFFSWQRIWRLIMAGIIIEGSFAALTWMAKVHYFAPCTCMVVLFITYGLRYLTVSLPRYRVGMIMVALLMTFQLSLNISAKEPLPPALSLGRVVESSQSNHTVVFTRPALKDFLLSKRGRYLVMIKYLPGHDVNREWVFNDADIDHSPIVWARDMGTAKNAELLEYFKDRQVWHVEVFWDIKRVPLYDKR